MTTIDRRYRLLNILREQPGIRVPDLAKLLVVSEGTIRNDLNALSDFRTPDAGLGWRNSGRGRTRDQFRLYHSRADE